MEFIEEYIIKYSCGCKHSIALPKGGGFWQPTGKETPCVKHSKTSG